MAKRVGRGRRRSSSPPLARSSVRTAVTRRPQASSLARVVPHLAPEALHQLIRSRGLEACGEIVAAATPAQLSSVLDLDLWRSAEPGHDESFDADRFGDWLEMLADAGGPVAARTVAAMDESVVVAGLSRYVRVFDSAAVASPAASDDEPIDVAAMPHEGPECEVGGYLVRAVRDEAWDAIVALLLELEAEDRDRFHAVMRGVRRLSDSTPEVDGLDDLLQEPEQLLHDVTLERERRRARQGYSTAADARAFLQMARRQRPPSPGGAPVNPLVAAYFRAADDEGASTEAAPGLPRQTLDPPLALAGAPEAGDAIGIGPRPSRLARIRELMESVRDSDPAAYLARGRELAFLANTLVAGCSIESRSFTPQEASEAAVGVCQLGLEHWPARWREPQARQGQSADELGGTMPSTFLVDHDLVTAFEVGWAVLHEEVGMFVAERLVAVLSGLRYGDTETQEGLDALRIEVTRQREAGTPWRARDALDVIATLDVPAWACLLGLLDECPVMPAALMAVLEGRTGAVSATEFEFISTRRQLGAVREFAARLAALLSQ